MPNQYSYTGYGGGGQNGYGADGYGADGTPVVTADPSRFRGLDPITASNPVIAHDQDPLDPFTGELVIVGEQPLNAANPDVKSMPRRKEDEQTLLGLVR